MTEAETVEFVSAIDSMGPELAARVVAELGPMPNEARYIYCVRAHRRAEELSK
jgi:hypothetical protein